MQGKNAVITGARGGFGRATVELFAENGANIWAGLRGPDPEFEAWAADLAGRHGVWIKPLHFDLTEEEAIRGTIRSLAADPNPVDVLVNCAGVAHGALLAMTSMTDLHRIFQVNFVGQVLLMQGLSRLMSRRRRGAIVNVVSVAGLDGREGYTVYGGSKAALAAATRTAARELGPWVRVNAVAPGLVETPMMHLMEEKARTAMLAAAALGRAARPREAAEAILFLASDRASFITGQILRVDGGL